MNNTNIYEFFNPFSNYVQYSTAMLMIKTLYSPVEKNYKFVAETIIQKLELNFSTHRVINFIQQILTYPIYGYDFVDKYETIQNSLISQSSSNCHSSINLLPTISTCLFCPKESSKLVLKTIRFEKYPTVYLANKISTLNLVLPILYKVFIFINF